MSAVEMSRRAHISEDGLYRYSLTRRFDRLLGCGTCTFVMLNPSTADADQDDPTIRRCIGYMERFGYNHLRVVNLYAYRATNPRDLWGAADPVGPINDHVLQLAFRDADLLIAAWGAHAKPERVAEVLAMAKRPGRGGPFLCLGKTKDGAPRHPLYLPANAELQAWP